MGQPGTFLPFAPPGAALPSLAPLFMPFASGGSGPPAPPNVVQVSNNAGVFGAPIGGSGNHTVILVGLAFNGGNTISSSNPTIGGAGVTGSLVIDGNSPTPTSALVYGATWQLPNVAPGGTTLGLTYNATGGASQNSLFGIEVDRPLITDGTPPAAVGGIGVPGSATSGTTAPVSGGNIIVGWTVGFALNMSAPAAPWVATVGQSGFGYLGYQLAAAAGGAYQFSTAYTGSGNWVAAVAAFQSH